MRRILLAMLALAGLVALVLAPRTSAVDSPADALEVSSAVLACPELAVTDDSASVLSGMVAADPGDDQPGGSADPTGAAALRRIDQERDLARVTAVADPVTVSVATKSSAPILMLGSGGWAPEALAGVASREIAGVGAGIASAACPTPGPEWWFVGSGSQLGRGAALLVSNPAQEPARFDITLYAASGPVEALAGKGIDLGPQSNVRLRLDALAQDQQLLAVQVEATAGRVAAALRDVAVAPEADSRGVDFLPPAVAPTTQLWVGALPGGADRQSLVLVNPGSQFATVQARLLTSAGTHELDELGRLTVPAGSVTSVPVATLVPDEGGTLALTSDLPVTAAVQSSWGGDEATQEVSWLAATPPISAPNPLAGAAAVPAGKGLEVSVTVSAPREAVSGVLTVIGSGRAKESSFSATGALADQVRERAEAEQEAAAAATAPANPTGAPGGSATPSATPSASPAGTPSPSPTASPGGRASASASPSEAAAASVEVSTADSSVLAELPVEVPAGQIRTLTIPQAAKAALLALVWRSAEGSGPAIVSHLALDPAAPLATGYSWWPTLSAVEGIPVREDVGVLAPTD